MDILNVGSVAFDDITTPFGRAKRALGGSATYFALAANFFAKPAIVAVVGDDFSKKDRKIFQNKKIDLSGLQQTTGKTFAWGGKYNFDLNTRKTLFTRLNVFKDFAPQLSVWHQKIPYVFLGNIHPELQLKILGQTKKPKLVGLDTMNLWIEKTPEPLARVLKLVNALIINDSEARQLSKEYNLVKAAKKVLGMMNKRNSPLLVIKQGEHGLLMFYQDKLFNLSGQKIKFDSTKKIIPSPAQGRARERLEYDVFNLPGYPLENVFDPTGAGDSFAGGFMGYLAKTNNPSILNLKRACVYGSVVASFCVEDFGTKRLQKLTQKEIQNRFKEFKQLTHFETV